MIEWTGQQTNALEKIEDWLDSDRPLFLFYGYAGTGKTTLLQYFTKYRDVRVSAYTNKAVLVLRRKGCPATTIHRMIYRRYDENPELRLEQAKLLDKKKKFGFLSMDENVRLMELQKIFSEMKFELNPAAFTRDVEGYPIDPPEFIAVDEGSMLNKQIGKDLLSFGIPLLVVMDPFQLPPIKGDSYFITNKPDVLLTEIHRQSWNSGILRMATAVRNGQMISNSFGADARLTNQVPADWFTDPESQLICGTHKTRFKYNKIAREGLGFEGELPVVGDLLCCWNSDNTIGLLNGSCWRVLNVDYNTKDNPYLYLQLRSEDEMADEEGPREIVSVAHKRLFLEAKPPEDWDIRDRARAHEFSYGYAMTCHKAQGSEWKKVVLIDESWCWGDPEKNWQGGTRNNWLYTGITRAGAELTVVRFPRRRS